MSQLQSAIEQINNERAGCAAASGAIMLSRADSAALLAFYARLDPAQSQARFGGTVTHGSLSRHCAALDWAKVAVAAWTQGDGIVAVAEMHLCTAAHPAVELAVACADHSRAQLVWREAIQIAAAAAVSRGCRTLHAAADTAAPFLAAELRAVGTVRRVADSWVCMVDEPAPRA